MLPYIRPYAEERYITKTLKVYLVQNLETQQIKWNSLKELGKENV
jgi:hypothetical protein